MLMERPRLDGDAAFDLLRTISQERNIRLHLVAEQLIEQRRLPPERTGHRHRLIIAAAALTNGPRADNVGNFEWEQDGTAS